MTPSHHTPALYHARASSASTKIAAVHFPLSACKGRPAALAAEGGESLQ